MPQGTALPPPPVEVLQWFYGPYPPAFLNHGVDQNAGNLLGNTVTLPTPFRAGGIFNTSTNALSHGGTGVAVEWSNYLGRRSIRLRADNNDHGAAAPILFPGWDPIWSAVAINGGARVSPAAAVLSWSYHFALSANTALPDDDRTGFMFLPAVPQSAIVNMGDVVPFAGTGGGFGIFANNDGAGGIEWEFVSWDEATILMRVSLAAAIPDVTRWSEARFTIVTGGGALPSLQLIVNDVVVLEQDFDDVSLLLPSSYSRADWAGRGMGYMTGWEQGPNALSNILYVAWSGYVGRFTPEGVEVEGI